MRVLSFRGVVSFFGAVALGISLLSCHKSDSSMDNSSLPVSGVMAFNLANDKSVTFALSGNALTGVPLAFTSYTGNYLTVYSGDRLVQSYDYTSGNVLDSVTYSFAPQKYYSLFLTGTNGHYHNIVVNDNYDSLSTTQAYVRYVNAIPDSSAPTVTITANGANVSSNAAPFSTVSSFASVAPGDVTIQVSNGGTINKSRTITLQQQTAYTVLLAGVPGSTGNDSLQIRYIANGSLSQSAHKTAATAGSSTTN